MRRLHQLRALLSNLFRRSKVDQDLSAELESYVDLLADERQATGIDAASARRAARLELGGVAQVTESVRHSRAGAGIERLLLDIRYAVRGLRRAPVFTLMAVTMLALGIGANTAVFSVADAALFKPLPYADPDHLVEMAEVIGRGNVDQSFQIGLSWKDIDRWREQHQVIQQIAVYSSGRAMRIDNVASVAPTLVGRLSPEVITLLGVVPRLGRAFSAEDARAANTVLLSEPFWTRAFGSSPAALGQSLTVDGRPYLIVGVMPSTFLYRVGSTNTVAWLPLDEASERANPNSRAASVIRLRPELPLERAEREIDAAAVRMQAGAPADQRWEVDLLPFDGRSRGRSTAATGLMVVMGAMTCVLLIACANIANLLLSRVFARQREIAVRSALGATRGRIVRLLLTEGLVLATAGGSVAVLLAWWTVNAAPSLIPGALGFFVANQATLDLRTLTFTMVAIGITAVICSLVPALRASQPDVLRGLEGNSRVAGMSRTSRRMRHVLQAVEIALTLVLLAGAGLLTSSFTRMLTADAGFDVDRLGYFYVSLPAARYSTPAAQRDAFDTLMEQVRHLNGVQAATIGPPPSGAGAGSFSVLGRERDLQVRAGAVSVYKVDPDYFSVAGIPLVAGRGFTPDDGRSGAAPVGIIDARTAQLYWPGESPLGKQFRYSPFVPWITVVGVSGHIKTRYFTSSSGTTQAFLPRDVDAPQTTQGFLVRTDGDPLGPLSAVPKLLEKIGASLTTSGTARVADAYDDVFTTPRFYLQLMLALSGIALLTAAIGIYGALSYSVNQRTREIGVRLSLGASRREIHELVAREAAFPLLMGIGAGLLAAWWLMRYAASLLYEVSPQDGRTFTSVVIVLVVVALVATIAPARRATRVDPIRALRMD